MNDYITIKITRILDEEAVEYGPEIRSKCKNSAHWTAKYLGYSDYQVCRLHPVLVIPDNSPIPELDN